jgi:predicted metalloprotease with PDZ domain
VTALAAALRPPLAMACTALLLGLPGGARGQAAPATLARPMLVEVDLTEAPRRLFHARLVIPVSPGPLTLFYPQWIPGEHMPSGPVADLAGLTLRAGGTVLPWRRDDVDMYALRVDVPAGATQLEVALDFLSPPPSVSGFSAGASATANLAMLNWNQVVLYPEGVDAGSFPVAPSVKLPPGWSFSTALAPAPRPGGGDAGRIAFTPVSLARLIDSPVLTGAHLREVPLGTVEGAPHILTVAGETTAQIELRPEQKAAFEKLVAEAQALFGAHHYDSYRFLTSVSDSVAHFGLEHHQSSDDRVAGNTFLDPVLFESVESLWAHEFVHSWNGKYRRPAGLVTKNYEQPMKDELLWVYEGLTQYLGLVLAARSGFHSRAATLDLIALEADDMQQHRGRIWRPLEDTAVAAQILYPARPDWEAWRRGVDFYFEATLIWLEVDTLLRERSKGSRSLDDFCRRFHGGKSSGPEVRPYTFEEVVAALNEVVPYDWRGLLEKRVRALTADAPLGGLEAAGWRLGYGPARSAFQEAVETRNKRMDLRASLGIVVDQRDDTAGDLIDVVPGSPAFRAGLGPMMRLVAVNGRKFTNSRASEEMLRAAVARSPTEKLELLVENAETFRAYSIDYQGGARYPRLEPIPGRKDLLSAILAPRTQASSKKSP